MLKSLLKRGFFLSALVLMIMFLAPHGLHAQTKVVTGTVKSGPNEFLPGVSVVQKGTTNGTVTDVDGKFSLSITDNAVLVFSFIGMAPKEVAVGNQTAFDITLDPDVTQLSEVVVIGYGTVERKDLTTSVSSVGAKQLKDIPLNSAAQALAGRLAGVQVVSSEGSPNAQIQIRVRGGGSITQDNTPLYVVDGIQVDNALSVISPQDIESIDVLKDASATAIYGARAANGVVMITTKGGREAKLNVSYNGLVGVRQLANKLDVMNPYEFVKYQYERSRGNSTDEASFAKAYGQFEDLELYKGVPFQDWQDKTFGRDAVMQTQNVSLSGGNAITQFNLSVSSNTEQGVMVESDFDRKLLNFKLDNKLGDRVHTSFNVRYNNTVVNGAGTSNTGSSSVNRLRQSVKYRPLLFPGQEEDLYDASYAQETNANSLSLVNPLLLAKAEYQKDRSSVANINGSVAIDFTKFLSFRSTVGIDITNQRINNFYDTITNNSRLNGAKQPIVSITTAEKTSLNNSNVLTFSLNKLSPSFAENNKLDVMIGQEILQSLQRRNYLESRNFPVGISADRAIGNMSLGTPQIPTSFEAKARQLSFFSRVNYSFKDKYLFAATVRADGSSKFGEANRWGYFPSASVAWRLSNETFMESLRTVGINDLKLRASYGEIGNNRIADFLYLTTFSPNAFYDQNNTTVTGYSPASLANSNLKWETTVSKNIGLDAGFLDNRIQLTVDVYQNKTKDLLLNTPVPTSSGYTTQLQNIGSTSNRGVELQLSGTPITRKSFSWQANFNISFNRNKIESLGRQESFLFSSGWAGSAAPSDYIVKVGRSVGSIWGLQSDGYYTLDDFNYSNGIYTLKAGVPNNKSVTSVDPQPGLMKYVDRTDDGQVNDSDRTIIGNTTPKFFGGLNQQFTYKNFDMSVFVNFQYGNKILNANKLEFTSGYTPNSNLLSIMNGRWTNINAEGQVVTDPGALAELNANATLWSPSKSSTSFYVNSWAVEDGSFIRINNITLGYSLPADLLSRVKINKLRVYGTVNNLAVFSKYSGYDPDVNVRNSSPITPGVDYSAYPRSRAYIVGVNLNF